MGDKEAYQAVDAVRMAMKRAVADEISGVIMRPMTKGLQGLLKQAKMRTLKIIVLCKPAALRK